MKNKQVKQMIVSVVLQGRKAIWHGEETEIFAANSVEQLDEEFGKMDDELFYDENSNVVSNNWKFWWTPCAFEIGIDEMKGQPVKNKDGSINPYYESLPLICGVYGDSNTIAMVSTSYY